MSNYSADYQKDGICLDEFVVVDIETTGIHYTRDHIIEIAAVKYSNFEEVAVFETLINPQVPIPPTITRITGIRQEDVESAPRFDEIEAEFLNFIGDLPLVGHNLCDFDIRFIEYTMRRPIPNPIIDTLPLARNVFPNFPNHRLATLKDILGIDTATSHRALADVKTTFSLLECCIYVMEHSSISQATNPGNYDSKYSEPVHQKYKKIDIKSIHPTCNEINLRASLYGKNIVFTGTLSIPREEAMQHAVNAGAVLKTGVSKNTDFLVVGQQDVSIVGADGMSSKEEKAHALNESGKGHIQIISEKEFLDLVKREGASVCTEQLDLFAAVTDDVWVYRILQSALESIVKYNNVDMSKLALKQGKNYSSVWYDTQMAFRICCRGGHNYFGISNSYIGEISQKIAQRVTKDGKSDGFTNFSFIPHEEDITAMIPFLSGIFDQTIDSIQKEFDCCSRYEECSNAGHCTNPNPVIATGCGYRRIMKKGRIFYGQNRNAD